MHILLDAYRKVWETMMFIKNPKKKDKDLQEKLRNIKPEVKEWVLRRYISYCKDQHAFLFLAYRRKLHQMELSKAEKLGFTIRVGMRKGACSYPLRHPMTASTTTDGFYDEKAELGKDYTLELDPDKLGPRVDTLLPCLDPDIKAQQKKDTEFMSQRYFESDEMRQYGFFEDCNVNMLAEKFPAFYSFYPTDACMQKLVRRMMQIKD